MILHYENCAVNHPARVVDSVGERDQKVKDDI